MFSKLENKDGTKFILDECLQFIQSNTQIIIFGAGVGGAALMKLIDEKQLENKICCFSDNNHLKHGMDFYDKEIVAPTELYKKYPEAKIIIASSAFPEIKEQLSEYGFNSDFIKLYNFAFSNLEYTDRDFIYDHIVDFKRSYEYMADDKSRNIFFHILNYKITKDNIWLDRLYEFVDDEKNQYFDGKLLDLDNIKTIVDIGSYIGDTLEHVESLGINFEKYYCFEADSEIFGILLENIKHKCNVLAKNIGLWDKKTKLYFSNLNPGATSITESKANSLDGEYLDVDTLDNLLLKEKIDFLKLDIEGAEYNALKGAKQVIQENMPVIAFAVYHKRDDYFKLLDLINEYAPNKYGFYFRQYRYTPTETICYAIPKIKHSN